MHSSSTARPKNQAVLSRLQQQQSGGMNSSYSVGGRTPIQNNGGYTMQDAATPQQQHNHMNYYSNVQHQQSAMRPPMGRGMGATRTAPPPPPQHQPQQHSASAMYRTSSTGSNKRPLNHPRWISPRAANTPGKQTRGASARERMLNYSESHQRPVGGQHQQVPMAYDLHHNAQQQHYDPHGYPAEEYHRNGSDMVGGSTFIHQQQQNQPQYYNHQPHQQHAMTPHHQQQRSGGGGGSRTPLGLVHSAVQPSRYQPAGGGGDSSMYQQHQQQYYNQGDVSGGVPSRSTSTNRPPPSNPNRATTPPTTAPLNSVTGAIIPSPTKDSGIMMGDDPNSSSTGIVMTAQMREKLQHQRSLFHNLHQVVVQLSGASVTDFQSIARLEQQLQEYSDLVKEQDKMLEDVEGLNVKLVAERDALLQFRRSHSTHHPQEGGPDDNNNNVVTEPFDAAVQRMFQSTKVKNDGGSRGSSASSALPQRLIHDDDIDATVAAELLQEPQPIPNQQQQPHTSRNNTTADTKAKERSTAIISSLINALRDEKRQRLAVEEQSSKLISEQQLAIHRLEQQVKDLQTTNRSLGGSGNIPTPSKAAAARTAAAASRRDLAATTPTTTPLRSRVHGGGANARSEGDDDGDDSPPKTRQQVPPTSRGAGFNNNATNPEHPPSSVSPAPSRPIENNKYNATTAHHQYPPPTPAAAQSNHQNQTINPRSLDFFDGEEGGDFSTSHSPPYQSTRTASRGGFLEHGFGGQQRKGNTNNTLSSEQQELRALSKGRGGDVDDDEDYAIQRAHETGGPIDESCCSPAQDYEDANIVGGRGGAADVMRRTSIRSSARNSSSAATSKSASRRSSVQREFDTALGATGFLEPQYHNDDTLSVPPTTTSTSGVHIPRIPLPPFNPAENPATFTEVSYTDRTLSDRRSGGAGEGFVRGTSTSLHEDDYIPPPTEKAPYRRGSGRPDESHYRSSAASSNSNWSSHEGEVNDNRRDPAVVSVPMSAQSSARSEGGGAEGSLAERAASLSQQMQQEVGRARSSSRSSRRGSSVGQQHHNNVPTPTSLPITSVATSVAPPRPSNAFDSALEQIRRRHNL